MAVGDAAGKQLVAGKAKDDRSEKSLDEKGEGKELGH